MKNKQGLSLRLARWGRAGGHLALIAVAMWVFGGGSALGMVWLVSLISGESIGSVTDNHTVVLAAFAVQFVAALAAVYVCTKLFGRDRSMRLLDQFGIGRRPSWMNLPQALTGYLGYFVSILVVSMLIYAFLPMIDLDQQQDIGFQPGRVTELWQLIVPFVALVVVAPLAEEMLFRGYLYTKMRALLGMPVGIAVTSIMFGVVHGQVNVGIDVAVLSVYLCLLREWSGSIWAGVILHSLKNLVAFVVLFVAPLV